MAIRIQRPPSPYARSWLLYIFEHVGKQRAVWLHELNTDSTSGQAGYMWSCSCDVNDGGLGRPLTALLLREAWEHFDNHIDPKAVPLRGGFARWNRGGQRSELNEILDLEVQRILGLAPELPVEVLNVCGECGENFEISDVDPHWATGRGFLCPRAYGNGRN